jgi:hypothetical protein
MPSIPKGRMLMDQDAQPGQERRRHALAPPLAPRHSTDGHPVQSNDPADPAFRDVGKDCFQLSEGSPGERRCFAASLRKSRSNTSSDFCLSFLTCSSFRASSSLVRAHRAILRAEPKPLLPVLDLRHGQPMLPRRLLNGFVLDLTHAADLAHAQMRGDLQTALSHPLPHMFLSSETSSALQSQPSADHEIKRLPYCPSYVHFAGPLLLIVAQNKRYLGNERIELAKLQQDVHHAGKPTLTDNPIGPQFLERAPKKSRSISPKTRRVVSDSPHRKHNPKKPASSQTQQPPGSTHPSHSGSISIS